ncbi:MAG: UPF0147 family protein [Nanoarchaeota archaeon]
MSESIAPIIEALRELGSDITLPKSLKQKIDDIITALTTENNDPLLVNRALSELSELSENVNMQAHIRTQLFNVIGLLETI